MMIIALRASFVVAIFRNRKQKMQKSELFKCKCTEIYTLYRFLVIDYGLFTRNFRALLNDIYCKI